VQPQQANLTQLHCAALGPWCRQDAGRRVATAIVHRFLVPMAARAAVAHAASLHALGALAAVPAYSVLAEDLAALTGKGDRRNTALLLPAYRALVTRLEAAQVAVPDAVASIIAELEGAAERAAAPFVIRLAQPGQRRARGAEDGDVDPVAVSDGEQPAKRSRPDSA